MSGRKYIGPWSSQPVGSLADISLHTQNGNVSGSLLGANASKGLYRVTASITVQVGATIGTASVILSCNGENGFNTYALPDIDLHQAFIQSGTFAVSADGTSDIAYSVVCNGLTVGSLAYSLRIVVEQLTKQA